MIIIHECVIIVEEAIQFKEEGNALFKQKEYKKALGKYTRVQCFTMAIMPTKNSEVSTYQNMSKEIKVIIKSNILTSEFRVKSWREKT